MPKLTTPKMIRLSKTAPAAPRVKPVVPPFKWLTWTEHYPHRNGAPGASVQRRGQFWSNGEGRSVWAITVTEPGSSERPELVQLFLRADGTVTLSWSEAKASRMEAARRAKTRSGYAAAA
jgi:hypothetical protein